MRTPACPRLFEVEGLRDGRLGGAERRSFERHLAGCSVCAREAESLERLAKAARGDVDHGRGADELHRWRERNRLLAAFDSVLVSSQPPSRTRRWLLWPTAVATVVAAVFIWWRARPAVEPVLTSTSTSRTTIHADGSTIWSKRAGNGNHEEVALESGVLRIHVDHASGGAGLVVRLPDGELEDVGTTFSVSADAGHTTRVVVDEGKVVLRLRGRPAIEIGAGDVWPSRPSAAPVRAVEAAAPPDRGAEGRPSPLRAVPVRRSHRSLAAGEPDPLVEFRAAMEALRTGDSRRAASAFASFLVQHPGDPMAEDAAYLRVIALQRSGDDEGVKRAVEDYLRRFPTGFRRAEIQNLSQ
jgi:FecR protein/Putative zinc-finger